jgi:PTS system N-acetylglucosamine-specific IIB component
MTRAERILAAIGGAANMVELEACITRVRVELRDPGLVDERALGGAGTHGVLREGRVVQLVLGPDADRLAGQLEVLL